MGEERGMLDVRRYGNLPEDLVLFRWEQNQNNYLLVEQLARLLLDGINELHLSG